MGRTHKGVGEGVKRKLNVNILFECAYVHIHVYMCMHVAAVTGVPDCLVYICILFVLSRGMRNHVSIHIYIYLFMRAHVEVTLRFTQTHEAQQAKA